MRTSFFALASLSEAAMDALLQLKGIDKAFPGVKALSGAALNVYPWPRYGVGGGKRRRKIHHDESINRHLYARCGIVVMAG